MLSGLTIDYNDPLARRDEASSFLNLTSQADDHAPGRVA